MGHRWLYRLVCLCFLTKFQPVRGSYRADVAHGVFEVADGPRPRFFEAADEQCI